MRPNVKINLGNGQLGRQVESADGTALLVVGVPTAYLADITANEFYSRIDAEVAGYTQEADAEHNALAWEHIKDFYAEAPEGSPLYVLGIANDVTLTELFTLSEAANATLLQLLQAEGGVIRLMAVALNPVTAEVAGASGVTADLLTAVPLAQAFALAEFNRYRPIDVVLEGRAFSATAAAAYDLRTLASNSVAVTIGRDQLRVNELVAGRTVNGAALAAITVASKYAAVGKLLGRLAASPVQRHIGRVRSGKLAGITQASLSGGALVSSLAETSLDVLTDKGYIFPLIHPGKDGVFYNEDSTCVSKADDYGFLKDSRVIHKAARIARRVYLEELNEDVSVDEVSGKLPPIEIANFQNVLKKAIEDEMKVKKEIVGVQVFVDPNQNVTATDKIQAVVRITKKGTAKFIEATVQFYNPFNS